MPQIQNATLAGGTAMSTTAQGSTNQNRLIQVQDLKNLRPDLEQRNFEIVGPIAVRGSLL